MSWKLKVKPPGGKRPSWNTIGGFKSKKEAREYGLRSRRKGSISAFRVVKGKR
jgi:hypothetical protein